MSVNLTDQRLLEVQLREVGLDASEMIDLALFEFFRVLAGIEFRRHGCLAFGAGQAPLAGPFPIVTLVICTTNVWSLFLGFTGFASAFAAP